MKIHKKCGKLELKNKQKIGFFIFYLFIYKNNFLFYFIKKNLILYLCMAIRLVDNFLIELYKKLQFNIRKFMQKTHYIKI
jgi:hypothetical protein